MPHWPYGVNSRGLASTAAVGLMKASLQLLRHRSGQRLAVPFFQLRLGIEEIELAGRAFHEHEDDVLRFGREVRGFWAPADRCVSAARAFRSSRLASAMAPMPPAQSRKNRRRVCEFAGTLESHRYSMVILALSNSSRLSRMRLTPTQSPRRAQYALRMRLHARASVFRQRLLRCSNIVSADVRAPMAAARA